MASKDTSDKWDWENILGVLGIALIAALRRENAGKEN